VEEAEILDRMVLDAREIFRNGIQNLKNFGLDDLKLSKSKEKIKGKPKLLNNTKAFYLRNKVLELNNNS